MVDSHGLRDVDLQADRACQHAKTVCLCLREEAYVVREIKVFQMSDKAPYNISFVQGQLAHDVALRLRF